MSWLKQTVVLQREALTHYLQAPMAEVAHRAVTVWSDRVALDQVLKQNLSHIPLCKLLYAVNIEGVQVSSNIAPESIDSKKFGQNLSLRPFLSKALPCQETEEPQGNPGSTIMLVSHCISTHCHKGTSPFPLLNACSP